jgi:hypothetical protein
MALAVSDRFVPAVRRWFDFLVAEYGFSSPQVKRSDWQYLSVIYRRTEIAVRIDLDMEETILVYLQLLDSDSLPEPYDPARSFLIDNVLTASLPDWKSPQTTLRDLTPAVLDDLLSIYARGLQTVGEHLLRAEPEALSALATSQTQHRRQDLAKRWESFVAQVVRGEDIDLTTYLEAIITRDTLEDLIRGAPADGTASEVAGVDRKYVEATIPLSVIEPESLVGSGSKWVRVPAELRTQLRNALTKRGWHP